MRFGVCREGYIVVDDKQQPQKALQIVGNIITKVLHAL
jgi:hypothetical protein